ncbi:bis-aminopropyl spermidine synthase family protein [Myceligenerans halotolerans]
MDAFGAYGRGHREAVAMLSDGTTLADVVRATALPRRLVEQIVAALGADLLAEGDHLRIRPEHAEDYRELAGAGHLAATALGMPADDRLPAAAGLLRDMERIVAAAPRPKKALDHVPATPETTVRRALWMDGTYDLAGATLLCVGDHDLTSIVTCLRNPAARAVVVDIDEDLLTYVDRVAAERGLDIETAYGDLRTGLPEAARGTADLVFTDPPYTPDGVRLFLARGLQGLRDRDNGRLLLAYGYGTHHPGLGFNVQQAIGELSLVYEAILPHFNRYTGAQAVGSASDLYVCRPTARTWRSLDRVTTNAVNIYTHGTQSLEAGTGTGSAPVHDAVLAGARGPDGLPVTATALIPHDPGATDDATHDATHDGARPEATELPLEALLDGSAQTSIRNARASALAADLSDDPGTWLFRVLLGVSARRVAVAVPNNHPDITSQAAQDMLRDDLAGKWVLTFRRSTPDSKHAILVADAVGEAGPSGRYPVPSRPDGGIVRGGRPGEPGQDDAPGGWGQDPVAVARRLMLGGASRRLANAWRDALVKAARAEGGALGKDEARALVVSAAADGGLRAGTLDRALVTLPRETVRAVLSAVAGSVARGRAAAGARPGSPAL